MHRAVKILKKKREALDFYSLYFRDEETSRATPGQFLMIWVPGVDEIPMSISRIGELCSISVLRVGEATKALSEVEEGDKIGIRGPYGNGFSLSEYERIAVVGGGSGMAPLLSLCYKARELGKEVHCFQGARSSDRISFLSELRNICSSLFISTDDGSLGFKGTVVELFEEKFEEVSPDVVMACGPEKMLYELSLLCEDLGIEAQISLERVMKCGIGLCGTCSINGKLVCKDGPVFSSKELLKIEDFGKRKRKGSGKSEDLRGRRLLNWLVLWGPVLSIHPRYRPSVLYRVLRSCNWRKNPFLPLLVPIPERPPGLVSIPISRDPVYRFYKGPILP